MSEFPALRQRYDPPPEVSHRRSFVETTRQGLKQEYITT